MKRLVTVGTEFRFDGEDGERFEWRGVTAFALLEQIAHGRTPDAEAFMAWAASEGFTALRVLAMLDGGLFRLEPAEGLQALPELLDRASARGLYVEVVALAGTRAFPDLDLGIQIEAVGQICANHPNALLELANENYHGSQRHQELTDPNNLIAWRARVPALVLTAYGATLYPDGPDIWGRADYVTAHINRDWPPSQGIEWLWWTCMSCPVVNDEPIGAGEVEQPGRRSANPDVFWAMGATSRVTSVYSTFHCEDGLRASVPGPVQQVCARAFMNGLHP